MKRIKNGPLSLDILLKGVFCGKMIVLKTNTGSTKHCIIHHITNILVFIDPGERTDFLFRHIFKSSLTKLFDTFEFQLPGFKRNHNDSKNTKNKRVQIHMLV